MRLALAVLGMVLVACVAWFFVRRDAALGPDRPTRADSATAGPAVTPSTEDLPAVTGTFAAGVGSNGHSTIEFDLVKGAAAAHTAGASASNERLEPAWAVLHGRIVDGLGSPLAGGVSYHLNLLGSGTESGRGGSLELDERGEFHIEIWPTSGGQVLREIEFASGIASEGEPELTAELRIDGDLAVGVHELGNIVLTPPRILATGWLTDDLGRPIQDASVRLWQLTAPGSAPARIGKSSTAGETDRDGRFQLTGQLESGAIELTIDPVEGYVKFAPMRIDVGTRGLELVLARNARVSGEVLVDDDFPFGNVLVCVLVAGSRDDTDGHRAVLRRLSTPGRAAFSVADLPAGNASVVFTGRFGPQLLRIDGVELVAGENTADPRFVDVDLRGLVKSLQVDVRDEAGAGIEHARVHARGSDGATEWSRVATADGRAIVCARALPIDLVIGAPGYRTQRVDRADVQLEVRLVRGLLVELALDSEARAMLGDDTKLAVAYERGTLTTPENAVWWAELAQPDADGVARVRVCEPGRFRVELRASRGRNEQFETFSAPCSPASIDVRDSDEPQRFQVTLPEAERERLRAFRER